MPARDCKTSTDIPWHWTSYLGDCSVYLWLPFYFLSGPRECFLLLLDVCNPKLGQNTKFMGAHKYWILCFLPISSLSSLNCIRDNHRLSEDLDPSSLVQKSISSSRASFVNRLSEDLDASSLDQKSTSSSIVSLNRAESVMAIPPRRPLLVCLTDSTTRALTAPKCLVWSVSSLARAEAKVRNAINMIFIVLKWCSWSLPREWCPEAMNEGLFWAL